MADFRPACFWFEPVDILRKLMLSGLLQFIARGTAAQVLVGCTLVFATFGLQVWVMPYHNGVANVLKVLVEVQLFFTFLISFILRVLPRVKEYEPVQSIFYGRLLLGTTIAFLTIATGLTIWQIWQRKRFKNQLGEHACLPTLFFSLPPLLNSPPLESFLISNRML